VPAIGDDVSTDRGHGPLLRYALSYCNVNCSLTMGSDAERGNDRLPSGSYFFTLSLTPCRRWKPKTASKQKTINRFEFGAPLFL